jgi:hypothetical protein
MSISALLFAEFPVELQSLVLSFLDYPSLITTLTVSKHINELVTDQPLYHDKGARILFLVALEDAPSNTNAPGTKTAPGLAWRWPNYSPKKQYICFLCSKIKPLRKFAQGQCYRMTLDDNYTMERKRFCLECGIKKQEGMGDLTAEGRKYVPGAMINSVDHGFNVHLCGGCGEWSPDFFCMEEKLCFSCTESDLEEPEKHVDGFEAVSNAPLSQIDDAYLPKNRAMIETAAVGREFLEKKEPTGEDELRWSKRPPCCRKCGGIWRFQPKYFGWQDGLIFPRDWKRGYNISGRARKELVLDMGDYMQNFCPHPNKHF